MILNPFEIILLVVVYQIFEGTSCLQCHGISLHWWSWWWVPGSTVQFYQTMWHPTPETSSSEQYVRLKVHDVMLLPVFSNLSSQFEICTLRKKKDKTRLTSLNMTFFRRTAGCALLNHKK